MCADPSTARACEPEPELPLLDRAGGRDGVELVRVEEHRRLGRSRAAELVVDGDRMKQLCPRPCLQSTGPLLDQAQAEVNVAEQPPLVGLPERRAPLQLAGPADVVEQRRS